MSSPKKPSPISRNSSTPSLSVVTVTPFTTSQTFQSLSPSSERPSSGRSNRSVSTDTSSGGPQSHNSRKELPPLFWYMEAGEWDKAAERARRHPREVKTWATLKTRADSGNSLSVSSSGLSVSIASTPSLSMSGSSGTKRLALHHACFKLRSAGSTPPPPVPPVSIVRPASDTSSIVSEESKQQPQETDPFIQICNFILFLIHMYPAAAGERETKHGCLPLHLASFASCASKVSRCQEPTSSDSSTFISRLSTISRRSASDATNMSAVHAEETMNGGVRPPQQQQQQQRENGSTAAAICSENLQINARREEMAVRVLNALLDAYPKAIRVDSEGGRLPLHTACAGRATPRVVSTLLTAYPAAARHRNKDGFLPLHLAAHWGVSHPNVAIALLRAYPDATVGRNRWERTPLEEALCMAGENGRPHQSALVRALRKHPSFWTRPLTEDLLAPTYTPRNAVMAVDVDESLPSNEDDEFIPREQIIDDSYGHDEFGQEVALTPAGPAPAGGFVGRFVNGKKKKQSKVDADLTLPLEILIQNRKWYAAMARILIEPMETEKELRVMTRGGFKANTGFFALHYACERSPPVDVVQALIDAYPMAVLTRCMPGGCLPLHIACTWHASPDIVRALLSADQGGVAVKDELGNVPLHSACFSGADEAVVEALIMTDPKAVLARNHQGSQPIDICKRLRHENRSAILRILTQQHDYFAQRHHRSRSTTSTNWNDVSREEEDNIQQERGMHLTTALEEQGPDLEVEVPYQPPPEAEAENQELLWI